MSPLVHVGTSSFNRGFLSDSGVYPPHPPTYVPFLSNGRNGHLWCPRLVPDYRGLCKREIMVDFLEGRTNEETRIRVKSSRVPEFPRPLPLTRLD